MQLQRCVGPLRIQLHLQSYRKKGSLQDAALQLEIQLASFQLARDKHKRLNKESL